MLRHKITYGPTYKGHPIMADKDKGQGCHTEILDPGIAIPERMVAKRNKVLMFSLGLNQPRNGDWPADNGKLTKFMATFVKDLDRKGLDPHYLWVRERSREEHQHYHACVWVNGSKAQSPYPLIERAEELWPRMFEGHEGESGLVNRCDKARDGSPQSNSVMIRKKKGKGHKEALDESVRRMSYLAKASSKGNAPPGVREFGCSRLKKG